MGSWIAEDLSRRVKGNSLSDLPILAFCIVICHFIATISSSNPQNLMNDQTNSNLSSTLVQVAQMYYDQELSQQEIAEAMGVSRSLIALYLKKARDQGIVKIEVFNPQDSCADLSHRLKAIGRLRHVTVVPTSHNSSLLTRRSIAAAMARHLEVSLKDGDCLGIGYGRTMAEVADQLMPGRSRAIDVVALAGETSDKLAGTFSQVNQQVQKVAGVFNGRPHFLLAPMILGSEQSAQVLLNDDSIKPVVKHWEHISHIISGVGSLPPFAGEDLHIGEDILQYFMEQRCVGDIYSHFFNNKGRFIDHPIFRQMVVISAKQISRAENFLLAANGKEKSIAAACLIHSGLVTDLFVDEELAQAILSKK